MTTVNLSNPTGLHEVFEKVDGQGTSLIPAVTAVDPVTGQPIPFATQTTLEQVRVLLQAIQTASAAIQAATEALNTSQVSGTVALDGPTLAALETVNTGGLTNTELRSTPVEVSMQGSATESTLEALRVLTLQVRDAIQTLDTSAIFGLVALHPDSLASLESVNSTVSNFPEIQKVSEDGYDTLIDNASATVTYVCEAQVGTATSAALWRVARHTVSGNVTTVRYAGTGAFNQIADNRASLNYA